MSSRTTAPTFVLLLPAYTAQAAAEILRGSKDLQGLIRQYLVMRAGSRSGTLSLGRMV